MRKSLILVAVAAIALVVLGGPALAGSKHHVRPQTQTASATYYGTSGSTGAGPSQAANIQGLAVGGASFTAPSWARSVKITIVDKSGQQVDARVGQYTPAAANGNSSFQNVATICHATNATYKLLPHFQDLGVNVMDGPCGTSSSPDPATTGTITVIFSSAA